MTDVRSERDPARLRAALTGSDPSERLRVTLAAGTTPDSGYIDPLVERCAVEPDFYVRDMLTWALTRHDPSATLERVLAELDSPIPQARSQALHTLSKLGDRRAWPAITPALLRDDDDEVARAGWRAATGLVPPGGETALAGTLVTQLGRGDRALRRSLSRAFAMLGEAALPAVERALSDPDPDVRGHAAEARYLIEHPDESFGSDVVGV